MARNTETTINPAAGLVFLLLALMLVSWGCSAQLLQQSSADAVDGESVLYAGARLITGDGRMIENGALLVTGSYIAAVGRENAITIPPGATRIDLSGKTLMPAMIDAHAHLGYEGYTSWGADNYSRETLVDHLERYSYYGFAAVFSAGSDPQELALEIQSAQQQGRLSGARLLFGAGMAPPDQGPNDRFLEHALAIESRSGMTVLMGLASARQARAAANTVAAKGIPFIKIWVDDRGGSQQKLAPEIYRPLLEEARRLDLKVFVHQQYPGDMPELLDAGANGFLHGRLGPELGRELAQQIVAADAFVVPNLGLAELRRERVADDPFLQESVPPQVIARLGNSFDRRQVTPAGPDQERQLRESMGHLLAAGVDILMGTDAGAVPDHFFGYTGHRELEIFVRLGMSPMQAVMAATSRPAQRLELDDLGTLAAGKQADFIVLDANPLENIRNTRTLSRVYRAGELIDRQALREGWRPSDGPGL